MIPLRLRAAPEHVLIILAWAAVVVPRLAQTLTAPKYLTHVGEEVPTSALAALLQLGTLAALAGFCLLTVLRHLDRLPTEHRGALVALLAPWAYLVVRDVYLGHPPSRPSLVYPLAVLALWFVRPRLDRLAVLGHLTGATAVLSLALGALLPAKGIYHSVTGELIAPEKQILPWGVLIGPFTNGNNLAQFLVLGAPALLLVRRRRWLASAWAGAVVLALVWTASRSSLAAAAVCLLVAAATALAGPAVRAATAVLALVVAGAVLVVLPLLPLDDTAFSNREHIWRFSLRAWGDSPVFGLGSRWYAEVTQYAGGLGPTAFHGHNQLVQTLVTGGAVDAALLGALALALAASAVRWAAWGAGAPTAHLVALLVSCTLEVSFGVVDRDFLLAVTVVPMAFWLFAPSPRPAWPLLRAPVAVPVTPVVAPVAVRVPVGASPRGAR